ncbi:carbohydrate ABC transporter permease [Nocardioides nematodiphilus]|uniref:carbohydrate ABC transporter permease n=1 Tax=Nocardioides nematodiphilus TaxID=2849669 RepID=UPI001CD9550A|nr:sugar ABC transporter permease [Nocardioides nematodiphilus]MCA1981360.1 sugar ABC transporter permease [Nocardioides nematodiphilus]
MSTGEKLLQALIVVAIFFAVVTLILTLTSRVRSRAGELIQSMAFVLPAVGLVGVGLLYPAINSINLSLKDKYSTKYVGFDNYKTIFTDADLLRVLGNTALWVVVTPIVATLIGLIYAVLTDHARFERTAKAIIFLPMAISLVGASLIWKFVYDDRIGLLNAFTDTVGLGRHHWLINSPWNNIWLIVILIWVQAGFAMTVLSASIKAIPTDIIEAAKLDGVGGLKMFRFITVPSIRPTLIVVLTTITITTLKAFDIVRQTTGGNYKTSVLSYEYYRQSFQSANWGLGSALAVLIFVLVLPVVIYNIRQMRKLEAR